MNKQTKKELWQYAASSLTVMCVSLLFSLLSLIFLIDKIPAWVKFAVSFVFIAPTLIVSFTQGRSKGEKLYRRYAQTSLSNIHDEQAVNIPVYKCIYHVILYVALMFIIFIVAVIAKSPQVRFAGLLFEFPVALLFSSVKVIDLSVVAPSSLAVFLPYTLIVAGSFVLGYILKVMQLKRRYAEIKGELRSYDN